MKTRLSTPMSVLALVAFSFLQAGLAQAQTKSLKNDFKTLGDNEEVIERVQKLDSRQKIRVVQNRMMDRNNRIELAMNFGGVSGGDSYVNTKNLGGMLQYHLTPRWSVGLGYEKAYNDLTIEGSRRYESAFNCQQSDVACAEKFPSVDFPVDTKLASLTFYPVYGKLNLFDSGISQFDLYTSIAYGQKTLNSGVTNVIAGSIGAGIWLNTWLTARIEGRYESYKDLLQTEKRSQSAASVVGSIGAMIW